jgi:hypothetical protein
LVRWGDFVLLRDVSLKNCANDPVFLGGANQKVMHKMLVFTAVAAVDCLRQLVYSLAHVSILRMLNAQKSAESILNFCEHEDVGGVPNCWECRGTSATGT